MYIFVGKFSENENGKAYLHLTHISAFRHQIGRILIVHVSNVLLAPPGTQEVSLSVCLSVRHKVL